jgi:hypothetical protein
VPQRDQYFSLTLAKFHVQQVEVELSGDKNPEQMRMLLESQGTTFSKRL